MDFKLVLILVVFSVIALQESSAAWPPYGRVGWVYAAQKQGHDVARELDENDDGFLDETELAKQFNERDIDQLIEALDDDGDNVVSVDEFRAMN